MGGDIAGDDLDAVGLALDPLDHARDLDRMAVGGVDDDHVHARLRQRHGPLIARVADGRGRADQQPALIVLGRVGVGLGLLDVLHRDQAGGAIVLVDDDDPLDLAVTQQGARLVPSCALAHGDQVARGHQLDGLAIRIGVEPHVAVGQDADQPAGLRIDHREARNLPLGHDGADFTERRLRRDGHRIDDHAAFIAFDLADHVGLFLDRHIAVEDAQTAGLGHGDGQPAFGDRVHGGRGQRDVQPDVAGQLRGDVRLGGHDLGRAGFQQNIVEGEPFAYLHEESPFCGPRITCCSAERQGPPGLILTIRTIGLPDAAPDPHLGDLWSECSSAPPAASRSRSRAMA